MRMPFDDDQPAAPAIEASRPASTDPRADPRPTASLQADPRPVVAPRFPSLPSRKALGLLVAAVFAIGLIAGAALGPAPSSSLAANSSIVERAIALLAARAIQGEHNTDGAAPTSTSAGPGARSTRGDLHSAAAHAGAKPSADAAHPASSGDASASGTSPSVSQPPSPSAPPAGRSEETPKPVRLPAIQHVWSIELAGSTFAAAEAAPTSYPYLVGQLIHRGTLLTNYTALDAYELAGDATLLPGGVGASLETISEPPCPAAASSPQAPSCPPDPEPGPASVQPGSTEAQPGPSEADSFLQRVLAPILASSAYVENGLIVISFAPVSSSEGATATTFSLQPTAGALLLSPLLRPGAHNASAFDSLSPRASVAAIFEH